LTVIKNDFGVEIDNLTTESYATMTFNIPMLQQLTEICQSSSISSFKISKSPPPVPPHQNNETKNNVSECGIY
jgi:hypothetical protein